MWLLQVSARTKNRRDDRVRQLGAVAQLDHNRGSGPRRFLGCFRMQLGFTRPRQQGELRKPTLARCDEPRALTLGGVRTIWAIVVAHASADPFK